ncbi:MAG: TolC family outer membrane protein [Pseudomonadota bacterium]
MLLTGVLLISVSARADDLVSIFGLALDSDPQYQAAMATHDAALEVVPQSLAVLLPDINLRADVSRNRFHDRKPAPGEKENTYYTNKVYSASLRQSVYHRDRFIALEQADSRVAQADAELESAYQELVIRVVTRYFVVLGSMDNLEFVKADKAAIARTLEQAQQRFEVGLAAITDVYEAQARYDTAVSDEINAGKLLDDAREALRELTGESPGTMEILRPEIPLVGPEPAVKQEWVDTALEQNPLILAARAATEAARQEIEIKRSGHYPTVDLTADYTHRNNNFGGLVPLKRNDSAIGLEVVLPVYQGGLVSSQTRESRFRYEQIQDEKVRIRREVERQSRDSFRGVQAELSKVKALRQARVSSEKALEASEAGFEVGTRTIVDVLDSQRELLRVRRDHARSRYDYLLNTLKLKQAAGILEDTDLVQVNELLQDAPKT